MITILSPAKTLDFETLNSSSQFTIPQFLSESDSLIKVLKKLSIKDISTTMKISHNLSEINYERFHNWTSEFNLSNSKQSIFCFKGGVYIGLDVEKFSIDDLNYSQNYLRVLSGLHGVLRPLDLIKPYRLEMGTKLKTKKGKNLYDFWGEKITRSLNDCLLKNNSKQILNLASNEYFSSIVQNKLKASIIDVKFLDLKNNVYKTISFFAKKARGAMASFVIQNQIQNIEDLKKFNRLGYRFDVEKSQPNSLVFTR
ncbi:MAG: hypothetical protein CMP65_00975 [Flavobacteriales bacterium]|nr:hypothetical protein [Flavobacteriales bacterium]|tara:strand:- start:4223 stop:4987 length:765 start_codon:yes stop_codon:yes gene_type:complete